MSDNYINTSSNSNNLNIQFQWNLAERHFKNGINFKKQKKYEPAIEEFSKAIELNSRYCDAYYNRGFIKSTCGDFKGALEDYTKTIEINPKYILPYYSRGAIKLQLEDFNGAEEDFSKAIELSPNLACAFNGRGAARLMLRNYTGAVKDFNKAVELDPNYFEEKEIDGLNKKLTKANLKVRKAI